MLSGSSAVQHTPKNTYSVLQLFARHCIVLCNKDELHSRMKSQFAYSRTVHELVEGMSIWKSMKVGQGEFVRRWLTLNQIVD